MTETTETEQKSEVIDFGFDATEADVLRPVIQGGTYLCTIGFVRKEASRQQNKPQLLVGYRLAQKAKNTQGNDVNPGFTIVQRILLQPTGGLTEKMIQDRIKAIHFSACGAGRVNTAEWVGKQVNVRINLREAHTDDKTGTEYPESNEVGRVMPVK